jgi:hypothetical protein
MDSAQDNPAARPATAARIYDYLLGGVHNFDADREVAQMVIAGLPNVREAARANRAFLGRGVRFMCAQGIDQFIDIGSGIPTQGNVHEITAEVRPEATVVYVDIDPLAVAESLDVLAGNDRATALRGDLRDPEEILAHTALHRLIDLSRPVGLLLTAVLHFVTDDDVAYGAAERLGRELAPGSYLLVSHGATEDVPEAAANSMRQAYSQKATTGAGKPRDHAEVERFFTGWDLVEPGIVWLNQWRPDPDATDGWAADPTMKVAWAGVARKP